MDAAGFAEATGVSRETLGRLQRYAELLRAWNERVNLVGKGTLADLWRRHMLDSAQLFPLLPEGARVLVDLGSGAGFPGLVLAAMGVPIVHLVESDARKCAFQREAARTMGIPATVHNTRIETAPSIAADVVTARALAPVDELLDMVARFAAAHTICVFPKGRTAQDELTHAGKRWTIDASLVPSRSDPEGSVLLIRRFSLA
jgi:16S rRNA (guanine527-N7)-methyltransferase